MNKNLMEIIKTETNIEAINAAIDKGQKKIIPLFKDSGTEAMRQMWGASIASELKARGNGNEYPMIPYMVPIIFAATDTEYQRRINIKKILENVANFDSYRVKTKTAFLHNDGYYTVCDGVHTIIQNYLMGHKTMKVDLGVGVSKKKEAYIFRTQNEGESRCSLIQKRKALVCEGSEDIIKQNEILKSFGLKMVEKDSPNFSLYRNVTSARGPEKVWKDYGEEGLKFTLQIIEDCGWGEEYKMYKQAGFVFGAICYKHLHDNPARYKAFIAAMKPITFHVWESMCINCAQKLDLNKAKHPETAVGIITDRYLSDEPKVIALMAKIEA